MKPLKNSVRFAVLILAALAMPQAFAQLPDLNDPAMRREYFPAINAQIAQTPNDYKLYLTRAFLYSLDNNLFAALADANRANALKPNDANVTEVLSTIYLQQGNFPAAVTALNSAIKSAPNEAGLYSNRALAYLKLNRLGDAQKDAVKAIGLDPNLDTSYMAIAEIMYRTGKYQLCINYCDEAIKRYPADPDAYYYRGCANEKLGKISLVKADKDHAMKLGYSGRIKLRMPQ